MQTVILQADELELAIDSLKEGVPVVIPTETVYGLAAPIWMPDAIQKIFMIKGRPSDNPLIVHVASLQEAEKLGSSLSPLFFLLAKTFWPGPLTLVVKKNPAIPDIVCAGLDSVALRFPSHPITQELIRKVGPLAAPSANLSGKPSPTTAMDALEDVEGKVPWIVDGGESSLGIESTVIGLLEDVPLLLRPGMISKEMIEEAIGMQIQEPSLGHKNIAPGMKYRHYAPNAKIRLVYDRKGIRGRYVLAETPLSGEHFLHEKTFYAALRLADRLHVPEIEILCSPSLLKNKALMNRITKASGDDTRKH